MDAIKTGRETALRILEFTKTLLDRYGPRIPGTQACRDAAKAIAAYMRRHCGHAREETFTMHPGSVFNLGRIISVAYVLSVILLVMGGVFSFVSLGLCASVMVYAVIHYFLYGTLFDLLFAKKTGCNVYCTVEPESEVRRQVIIMGHHDSPYVFSFFSRLETLAGIRFLFSMLFFVYITVISAVTALQALPISSGYLIAALAGLPFMIPVFFFISRKPSPGAGDNLNGSSIAVHIARHFAELTRQGRGLKHTRVVALSTDGEEAGQRGAIDYVKRHSGELRRISTYVLNMDSIYHLKDISILLRDRHGIVRLSPGMAKDCADIANRLGYAVKTIAVPFGSGTDAAPFAKAGVQAATLIGMSASLFEKGHLYHTLKDTVDCIETEAVEAAYDIAINYIVRMDGQTP